jgi:tetratricopeptide (TPR) repeat protein
MTEEALFEEALSRPLAERAVFLEQACAGQPELRAAVDALLAAHGRWGNVLDKPPQALGETVDSGPDPAAASVLAVTGDYQPQAVAGVVIAGRYTLVEKIGEGGMGEVWVAKQTEPVKRKVALKLIKAGMETRAVVQRFEQERQALALMDHPNIARVLDGGMTPDRRPFFVMELVNGAPLTRFCDEVRLTPEGRLELFVPICQAVQHAHQKGIVHRDLKPSNILVTLYDGKPVPKIIDFGVAKATGGKLIDESLSTNFGAVVGTLEYMAPEQAGLSAVDIDTRADIYSLGVILYELLTGLKPHDGQRLRKAALTEMVRIIQEEEPSKPSTRLSTNESLPSLAALRQTEPRKLMAMLRGELDWVVMKCLEKQRDRRYETANALARDIQRYLAQEPVEARPPTAGYRLSKFLRRNKGAVVAASLVLLVLLGGMIGTSIGMVQAQWARAAEAERADGESRAKVDAQAARDDEAKERAYAEAIAQFVKDDFLALTSVEGQERFGGAGLTRNATLRELLDRASEKLNERKDLAPRTEAELCWIIGVSYRGLGDAARAIPFLQRSVELHRQASGPAGPATLNAQNSLAVAYNAAGQYSKAVRLNAEALKLWKAKAGTDSPRTLFWMARLAASYRFAGKLDLAVPLYEETLTLQKAQLGADHPETLNTMSNLGEAYKTVGKLDRAVPLLEETVKRCQANLGREHRGTLNSMSNLAAAYKDAWKLDLALPLCADTLKLQKAKLGPEHPDTLSTMVTLALAYLAVGKTDLAVPLCEETLKFSKAKLGPEHPVTLIRMGCLAEAYRVAGKLELALPLCEEALKLLKTKLGSDDPDTVSTMGNIALAYMEAGKLDIAVPLCEETLKLQKAQRGLDQPATLAAMGNLAEAYRRAGKLHLALPLCAETLRLRRARLGPEHLDTLNSMHNLAGAYMETGKLDQAVPLFEEAFERLKSMLGLTHPHTVLCMANLTDAYRSAKRLDKSIFLFEQLLKRQQAELGQDHRATLETEAKLGVNYKDAGRLKEAIPLLKRAQQAAKRYPQLRFADRHLLDAYAIAGENEKLVSLSRELLSEARATLPKHSPQLAQQLALLSVPLLQAKSFAEAEPLLRECLAIRERTQPDAWSTFNTKSMLGDVLLGRNKYADAEPLLRAGYEGMKQREKAIPPQANTRVPEAIGRLVRLYEATGKTEQAARWRKELEATKAAQKEPEKQ